MPYSDTPLKNDSDEFPLNNNFPKNSKGWMLNSISRQSNSNEQVDGKRLHPSSVWSRSLRSSSAQQSEAEGGLIQPEENKWLSIPQPQAIQRPTIDPHLEELNAVVRSTECLRHFMLSVEFWISPGGRLRQWMKLNICLAAFLLIPAVFLMPIIGLVLHEVDGMVTVVTCIAWKLILLSTLISVVVCVIQHRQKHFPSSSPRSSGRRK